MLTWDMHDRQRGLCRQPLLQKTTSKPSPEENSLPANHAAACQRPVCPVLWRQRFQYVFNGYRLSSCLVQCLVSKLVYMICVHGCIAVAGLLSLLVARAWFLFCSYYCLISFCCCHCFFHSLLHWSCQLNWRVTSRHLGQDVWLT